MSKVKKIFLGILIVALIFCVIADAMFLVIKYILPDKITSNTYHVNELTVQESDGSTTSLGNIFEIKYYANSDGSGVEMLDIKMNYLKDEKSSTTFSSGIQLVNLATEEQSSFNEKWVCQEQTGFWVGNWCWWGTRFYSPTYENNSFYYNTDGENYSYKATQSINDDNYFLITIGNEKFRMALKHSNSEVYSYDTNGSKVRAYVDFNYLTKILYSTVSTIESGYDGTLTLKFADLFDYYGFDEESGQYSMEKTLTADGMPIKDIVTNYYTVKLNTYSRGAQTASDSLFGIVANDYNYNKTNSSMTEGYYISRNIVTLTEYDFDYKLNSENTHDAYLKDNVKQYLDTLKDYKIEIKISKDKLFVQGVIFNEVVYDDYINDNTIYKGAGNE
jgi:hypothetical protein